MPVFNGGDRGDGDSLLTRTPTEKTRGDGYKLLLGRFRLDIKRLHRGWASLSRLRFFQDQMILEVPSSLEFHDSVI